MIKRKMMQLLVVAGAASALTGCAQDFSMDFELESSPPITADVSVSFEEIRMHDGYAVAVKATPRINRDEMDWETDLELDVTHQNILEVDRLEYDKGAQEERDKDLRDGDWRFLIWGKQPGTTTIEVYVDGEYEAEIPVRVNPQPE